MSLRLMFCAAACLVFALVIAPRCVGQRDIGPLAELEAYLAPRLQGTGTTVIPWFSDSHVQFAGPGWNEAEWREYLRLIKLAATRASVPGFVGLGDYGGPPPWAFSSLNKFAEILHGEIGPTDPQIIAGIGNHEWLDGVGRRPWMEAIYTTLTFPSFTTPTENDRPLYHAHTVGDPGGPQARVVVTDSSGTKGPGWIVAETIGNEQLHWLHKTLRATREEGLSALVFDHYPDVQEQGGALVPVLTNGFQRLRVIRQFDFTVRAIASGHIGEQTFRIAGNHMRIGCDYLTRELGPQAFELSQFQGETWVRTGQIYPDGTWLEDPPTYTTYSPSQWGYVFGFYPYGHSSISDIRTDVPILTSTFPEPVAGGATAVRAEYAPPGALGIYLMAPAADILGTQLGEVVYFIDPTNVLTVNVQADAAGNAVVPVPLGPGTRRAFWYGQFFFAHPVTGELCASDAHRVVVQ